VFIFSLFIIPRTSRGSASKRKEERVFAEVGYLFAEAPIPRAAANPEHEREEKETPYCIKNSLTNARKRRRPSPVQKRVLDWKVCHLLSAEKTKGSCSPKGERKYWGMLLSSTSISFGGRRKGKKKPLSRTSSECPFGDHYLKGLVKAHEKGHQHLQAGKFPHFPER